MIGESSPNSHRHHVSVECRGHTRCGLSLSTQKSRRQTAVLRHYSSGQRLNIGAKYPGVLAGTTHVGAGDSKLLQRPLPLLPDQMRRKPAFAMDTLASRFFMNIFQTNPLRRFSAMSRVIPTSMPMTSGANQPLCGLKASMKP